MRSVLDRSNQAFFLHNRRLSDAIRPDDFYALIPWSHQRNDSTFAREGTVFSGMADGDRRGRWLGVSDSLLRWVTRRRALKLPIFKQELLDRVREGPSCVGFQRIHEQILSESDHLSFVPTVGVRTVVSTVKPRIHGPAIGFDLDDLRPGQCQWHSDQVKRDSSLLADGTNLGAVAPVATIRKHGHIQGAPTC